MKNKLLTALCAIALFPFAGFSQIDIIPTYGYNFGANVPIYGGELKIKGNSTFGVNVDYNLDRDNAIQFSYTTTISTMTIRDYNYPGVGGSSTQDFSDVLENYFLLGGVRYFSDGPIQPYGNFNVGMAYYKITDVTDYYAQYEQQDMYRFAIGFGLGAKIMFSEKVGLDLHVRALAPIQWGGIGIGVGTGGASAGAYAGSTFISGDVGGGLIIRLGE